MPPAAARLLAPLLLATLAVLPGCAPASSEGTPSAAQAQRPVNDGILETGEPGVVLLYHAYYGVMCTGSIIGKRVVLTAKHCVQNDNGQMFSATGWQVYVGTSPDIGWGSNPDYTVSEVRKTPGADIENADLALLILNSDAQQTPYRYRFKIELDGFVGSPARIIGYGLNACVGGSSGTKYRGDEEVIGWYSTNDFITQGYGANEGDSGGPLFDPETMEILGVVSRGPDCQESPGMTIASRVDVWRDFINQALEDTGDCAPTSVEEICDDGIDNNCDGTVDEGCGPVGTTCETDADCASRFCRDVGTGDLICTTPCNPLYGGEECAEGSYCKFLGCDQGGCAPGSAGTLWVGEPCQKDTDCLDLMCGDPGLGTRVCMAYCGMGLGNCLATEACAPHTPGATCGGCLPDRLLSGPFYLGERCTENSDCRSGYCVDDGGFHYCSTLCSDESGCAGGFHCRDGHCVRGEPGLVGEPCLSDQDCNSTLQCLGASDGNPGFCTSACSGGNTCPTGTECEGVVCALDGLPLGDGCVAGGDCQTRGCFSFGGSNACTLTCDRHTPCPPLMVCTRADNGMTLCQPNRLPVVEIGPDPKPKKDCSTGGAGGLPLLVFGWVLLRLFRRRD